MLAVGKIDELPQYLRREIDVHACAHPAAPSQSHAVGRIHSGLAGDAAERASYGGGAHGAAVRLVVERGEFRQWLNLLTHDLLVLGQFGLAANSGVRGIVCLGRRGFRRHTG